MNNNKINSYNKKNRCFAKKIYHKKKVQTAPKYNKLIIKIKKIIIKLKLIILKKGKYVILQ